MLIPSFLLFPCCAALRCRVVLMCFVKQVVSCVWVWCCSRLWDRVGVPVLVYKGWWCAGLM